MKKLFLALLLFATITCHSKEIVLTADNTVSLYGVVEGSLVSQVISDATALNSKLESGYPIYLFMNTPGGSIQAGLELIEFTQGLNRPVHTITLFAASMGWQIVQHLEDRYVLNYGVLMSHKAKGQFSGEFGGTASQIDSRFGLWLRRVSLMDRQTVNRTNGRQTLESYRLAYQPELWLNGAEAVQNGYADEVVTVKCDDSLLKHTNDTTLNFGFFQIKVKLSKCPLKTYPSEIEAHVYTNKGILKVSEFLNQDGKFSKECNSTSEGSDYWSSRRQSEQNPNQKEELCAKGEGVTLEKINQEIKKIEEYYQRNFKNHVVYSY